MAVNPDAISNINPITLAMGETENESNVAITNNGTVPVFEPLTRTIISPGDTETVLVQGDVFLADVEANLAAIAALSGVDVLEVIVTAVSGGWPLDVDTNGGVLAALDVDGYRLAEWDGVTSLINPLSTSTPVPCYFVVSEAIQFATDYLIRFKMPLVPSGSIVMIGISDYPTGNFDTEPNVAFKATDTACALVANAEGSSPVLIDYPPVGEVVSLRLANGQIAATSATIGTAVAGPVSSIVDGSSKSLFVVSASDTSPAAVEFKIEDPA